MAAKAYTLITTAMLRLQNISSKSLMTFGASFRPTKTLHQLQRNCQSRLPTQATNTLHSIRQITLNRLRIPAGKRQARCTTNGLHMDRHMKAGLQQKSLQSSRSKFMRHQSTCSMQKAMASAIARRGLKIQTVPKAKWWQCAMHRQAERDTLAGVAMKW